MTRLSRLKSVQAAVSDPKDGFQPLEGPPSTTNVMQVDPAIHDWHGDSSAVSFDKHFNVENANPTCWQFFGSSSAYALAVEVAVHARKKFGPITSSVDYVGKEFALNAHTREEAPTRSNVQMPSRQEVELLVAFYMATTNSLMAYIDVEMVAQDIEAYFAFQGTNPRALTGRQAHQYFRLSMICATAAANKARHQPHFHAESLEYYVDALQCVEEVTSDVSPDALVALLLLINFVCFYPRKGDLWKLLDFACRLSVELNYHTEPREVAEDVRSRKRRRSVFWGLYCIERTIGQHFGRPSDLTEEIITAEYPVMPNDPQIPDPSEYQHVLASHYYRLCYLRSEIFRDLYMPARAPNFPRLWYEQRLESILAWREELHFLDNVLGMGSMICDMGFESSVCFLFQPILLRALVAISDATLLPDDVPESVPKESYYSAVRTVEFYAKVFREPEHTPYGMYPITITSVHYIYCGVMVFMAHCLLALDGRLPVRSYAPGSTFAQPNSSDPQETDHIDFSGIQDLSNNCLFVLNKVAELFPGTVGMLDMYRSLSDKVVPALLSELG